jgi:hypothetical protein
MLKGYFNTDVRPIPSKLLSCIIFLVLGKRGKKKKSGPDLHPYPARQDVVFFVLHASMVNTLFGNMI